jgi:TonB family protein
MARHDARTQYRWALAVGLAASVAIHVFLFLLSPTLPADSVVERARALQVVHIPPAPVAAPPETDVPAQPAPIPSPATPVVADLDRPPTEPEFIPYEIAPKLENPAEIQRLLQDLYPVQYREQRIGGVVVLWLYIDSEGNVARVLVRAPSGHTGFDEAAQEVAHHMAFRPAYIHGHPVGVWVSQGIRFTVHQAADTNALRPGPHESPVVSSPTGGTRL